MQRPNFFGALDQSGIGGLPSIGGIVGGIARSAPRAIREGGLLGGGMPAPYTSFNPFNSPSASMFDQYMRQQMGPAPFMFNAPFLSPISREQMSPFTPNFWGGIRGVGR